MSSSFEISEVDHLTTGAIGPPGQRVFYLQARQGKQVVSLRLEKAQVAALVAYLAGMLSDMPPPAEIPSTGMDLIEPVVAEWVVGSLGVTYDEDADRVVILAEELVEEGEEPARIRISATREQIAALSVRGAEAVAAGRPPCPLCGQPLDPEGHTCPRLNGHRER
ncbi:MAG: hypothetical protein AVDCRST_MAG10-1376 [uncultured Acidimicrobiales bacterium]|uniref:DUF3090 domain-containing protein n=1 Tax=uncultured Acidimicrobiales bacterium TaxID=310071 RepID=A0A6J4HWQ9_9ACTN|nr:MAG: hypothetical protein AVDCRST_MAG10-1376 [uncultured Acidimicrobiales bacterium]